MAAIVATQPAAQVTTAAGTGNARAERDSAVRLLVAGLALQGEGEFRWFGLAVYHARLWAPEKGWRANEPFALEIRYARAIRGERLAATSVDEMRHTGAGTEAQRQQWGAAMRAVFPDVADGDRLIGLAAPGAATRFFVNGKPIGEIDDPAFGPAFFGIWMSPATSRPDLRRMLLGQGR